MAVWGLILSALGALIVAWGQSDIARSVHLWLTALELEKDSRNSRRDIYNVVADKRMKKSVKLDKWHNRHSHADCPPFQAIRLGGSEPFLIYTRTSR